MDKKLSSPKLCPSVKYYVTVMVRAFKDEPVKLHMLSLSRKCVEVSGQDMSKPMGFPPGFVYVFDGNLFELLLAAFTRGSKNDLNNLWSKAERLPVAA